MVRGRAVECELRHPEQGGAYIEGGAALDTERARRGRRGKRGEGPSLELDGNIITSEKPSRDLTRAFNRLPRALADFRHFDPLLSSGYTEPEDTEGWRPGTRGIRGEGEG